MTFHLIAEDEMFVDIEDFEGLYSISNYGRVYSHHGRSNKCLTAHDNGQGYLQVRLCNAAAKIEKQGRIHILVAEAFIGYRTEETTVDHINRNTHDNRASNLRLATYSQQIVNQRTRSDNQLGEKNIHEWCDSKDGRMYWRILIRRHGADVLQTSFAQDIYSLDDVKQKRDEFLKTLDY